MQGYLYNLWLYEALNAEDVKHTRFSDTEAITLLSYNCTSQLSNKRN